MSGAAATDCGVPFAKARPSRLTPDVHERIVATMRAGNFRETAAAAAGIQSKTLRDWLRRGAHGEHPFDEFLAAISVAEAEAEVRVVEIIGNAAKADWRAAAWCLGRKNPSRWAYQVKLAVIGHVKAFLANQTLVASFLSYPGFPGTVNVGSADIDGDGNDDILTTPLTSAAHVKAFSGDDLAVLLSFLAQPEPVGLYIG